MLPLGPICSGLFIDICFFVCYSSIVNFDINREIIMAVAKLSHAERGTILAGLASLRAVLVRKSRAEKNAEIVKIVERDIASLDALGAKVNSHELEL